MINYLLTALVFLFSVIILFRLFTFQRKGATFRRSVSVVATVVMMVCVITLGHILSGDLVMQAELWPLVVYQGVMAFSLVRTKGNLSPLLFFGPDTRGA